jgi:hypothetical protein
MKTTATLAGIILSLSLLTPAAAASPERDGNLQNLVDELRTLRDQARNRRAADRWLLQSLDDLVTRYDWPWRNLLVMEEFSDGDFSRNPAWQTVSGQFWIDRRLGLRCRVTPRIQDSTPRKEQDLGEALLGALIDEALGPDKGDNGASRDDSTPAEIHLPLQIPTGFALESSFSFHGAPGENSEVSFALFQNQRGSYGYQLNLLTGRQSTLELVVRRGGRISTIELADLKDFKPSRQHTLQWRHHPQGKIEVILDGERLFTTRDRSFRNPFDRLAIINSSGDFALQNLSLYGAQ